MKNNDIKKMSIIRHPLEMVKMYFQLKIACMKICGDWNGVKIHTNGTVEFVNDKFYEFVMSCMKPMERENNKTEDPYFD